MKWNLMWPKNVILCLPFYLAGCFADIAATNPYDPETPIDLQKTASVTLAVFGTHDDVQASALPTPLADAEVSFANGPNQGIRGLSTDENGELHLAELTPGSYQIHIWHPQYGSPRPGQAHFFSLAPGDQQVVSVYLPSISQRSNEGGLVAPTIIGKAYKPYELALPPSETPDHSGIVVNVRTETEETTSIQTTTESDGSFALALNPGVYKLYFNAPDHLQTGPELVVVEPNMVTELTTPVVLIIKPGMVTGVIHAKNSVGDEHQGTQVSLSSDLNGYTTAEGTFTITEVPAGLYNVQIFKDGYDSISIPSVLVRGGRATDIGRLELRTSRGSLRGQVSVNGYDSAEGVVLSLVDDRERTVSTTVSDAEGRFAFSEIMVGHYSLHACKTGFRTSERIDVPAIVANSEQSIPTFAMDRPVIGFPDFSAQVNVNSRNWRLNFDIPHGIQKIRISGDAIIVDERNTPISNPDGFETFASNGAQGHVDLLLTDRDGPLLLTATFSGSNCYLSEPHNLIVSLDRRNPSVSHLEILPGAKARDTVPKYTDERTVRVKLEGVSGASLIHYCARDREREDCGPNDLRYTIPYTSEFEVDFNSDGEKQICARLSDSAGNDSGVTLCDTITVDTTPPPPPTLPRPTLSNVNASCAYIEVEKPLATDPQLGFSEDFSHFEFRELGQQWTRLTADHRDPNRPLNPRLPNTTEHIRFSLNQDATNLLQIRAVDFAGNTSEPSTAVVNEVSTRLTPTSLEMKQACNGGQYVILKERLSGFSTGVHGCNIGPATWDTPEVALLDFDRGTIVPISSPITVNDLQEEVCSTDLLISHTVIDAACSPQPGEPALLIIKPTALQTPGTPLPCIDCNYGAPSDCKRAYCGLHFGALSSQEYAVMPDPIDAPNQPLISLFVANSGPRSLDGLKWTQNPSLGNYSFNALEVTTAVSAQNFLDRFGIRQVRLEATTNLFRLTWSDGNLPARWLIDSAPSGSTPQSPTSLQGLSGPTALVRGTSLIHSPPLNSRATYIKFDESSGTWRAYRKNLSLNGIGPTHEVNYPDGNTSAQRSPYNVDIRTATWLHTGTGSVHPSELTVRLHSPSQTGQPFSAIAQNNQGQQRTLGIGAPPDAQFFEVGLNQVWWIDVDEPSIIYQSSTYGQNPIQLRYPIDVSKPILPVRSTSLNLGDPFIMYHTTGISTGIVIAYLNENDESQDVCAR